MVTAEELLEFITTTTAYPIQVLNWRVTFAVLGVGGMLLSLPLVYFLVQDRPPYQDWQDTFVIATLEEARKVPLSNYCRDRRFWFAVVGGSLNAFCAFGLLTGCQ